MEEWNPKSNLLTDYRIVVLAQVPGADDHSALSSPVLEAEEAMADIVRAIVAHGGVVTVLGDEALAMVALVTAGEYTTARVANESEEPRVIVCIPRVGEGEDEAFAPFRRFGIGGFEMMAEPMEGLPGFARRADAMVIIGNGPADAIRTFREHAKPGARIFAIAASGGLAAAIDRGEVKDGEFVRILDREIERDSQSSLRNESDEPVLPPIALAAQKLVDELRRPTERAFEG